LSGEFLGYLTRHSLQKLNRPMEIAVPEFSTILKTVAALAVLSAFLAVAVTALNAFIPMPLATDLVMLLLKALRRAFSRFWVCSAEEPPQRGAETNRPNGRSRRMDSLIVGHRRAAVMHRLLEVNEQLQQVRDDRAKLARQGFTIDDCLPHLFGRK
jgi:hypothetical protein